MSKKLKGSGNPSIKQFLRKPEPSTAQTIEQEAQEAAPAPSKKKIVGNLNAFIVKKSTTAKPAELPVVLYQPNELINKCDPKEVFEQVPILLEFAAALESATEQKKCVKSLLLSFLTQRKSSLWSSKYTPKDLTGMFHEKTVNEIKSWLRLFSSSRTNDDASDGDFQDSLNDQRRDQLLCSQKSMIVYGREGVGKMTLLKSIACTMNMEVHVCSNELDRFKYLKEKDENTKSQCVKVRKGTPTPSVLLTDFLNKKDTNDDSTSSTQPRKVQIIHEINLIYPSQRRGKFHQDLIKLMKQSMIPFIFTSSEPTVPNEYKDFQKVEFKELPKNELAQFFWLVYHIEACMSPLFTVQALQKDNLYPALNSCFKDLKLQEHITIQQLQDMIQLYDFKLNRVFNFLQFRYHNAENLDFEVFKQEALMTAIESAENTSIEKVIVNIPSQHFTSNLTETYQFSQNKEETLKSRLAYLEQVIEADVLDHANQKSNSMSPFHRRSWLKQPPLDLNHVVLRHHYQMQLLSLSLVRPEQMRVKSRLARMINHYQISSYGAYSSLRSQEFQLVRLQTTRKQRRPTRQLLEEMIGADYARYLVHFSQLG